MMRAGSGMLTGLSCPDACATVKRFACDINHHSAVGASAATLRYLKGCGPMAGNPAPSETLGCVQGASSEGVRLVARATPCAAIIRATCGPLHQGRQPTSLQHALAYAQVQRQRMRTARKGRYQNGQRPTLYGVRRRCAQLGGKGTRTSGNTCGVGTRTRQRQLHQRV